MKNSVIEIRCAGCDNKFRGFFKGLFDVSKTYEADCPICEGQNFFGGPATIVGHKTPDGAVKIMHVDKL